MTTIVTRTAVLAATVLMMSGVAVSSASASVGQHRIIPGQTASARHPQHAERNAPDLYCDKQESKCQ
ncbi:hypothetical protein [Lichenibacterium ramalinae]|nr:hypothetical protein [Lichenibacterium ramalinae]